MKTFKTILWLTLTAINIQAHAAEVDGSATTRSRDWLSIDRQGYQERSSRLSGPELIAAMPQVLSFAESAKYNIRNGLHGEYATIAQRNAFYDLVSLVIEHDNGTVPAKRGVRFFHAATIVTARLPLGAVDTFAGFTCTAMTDDVRKLLRAINERLFETNFVIIKRLLLDWDAPRNPRETNGAVMDAWTFDLAMVDLEQATVSAALASLNPSQAVRASTNAVATGCNWAGRLASRLLLTTQAQSWLDRAGLRPFDFFNETHRKAMGKAIVTMLHRKSEADFRQAIGVP